MVGEAGIEPATPSLEGSCSIQLSYSPVVHWAIVAFSRSGKRKLFAAKEGDDGLQSFRPVLVRVGGIGAERLDVEADCEAFLGADEIDESGAEDAFDGSIGGVDRVQEAGEANEAPLALMERDEEGALAPEKIEVACEAVGRLSRGEIEIVLGGCEFIGRHDPGVTLRGEDGRADGVEGTERLSERRMKLRFRDLVEGVGIFAEVNEANGRGNGRRGRE